ncbi:MAG: urate oxidase [Ignavibacteria bacterium]|nr:urate oxidase [Ignavibacteria bacterium]
MSAIITHNNYGKSGVRLLKIKRDTPVHEIKEMTVNIQLEGDFETVHTEGDNRKVLPTDTMKNTVYALAKENPVRSSEEFGVYLAKYFIDNNKQVSGVSIEIEEKLWQRIMTKDPGSKKLIPHDHSFVSSGEERNTAKIRVTGKGVSVESGITGLLVLKTTESGFENYIKDKYTTLKETSDRVFSTSITAVWSYANQEVNYLKVCAEIRQIILETFAAHHSLSVQQTLFETGRNVIEKLTEVKEISLSMPNKHYLLFNLEQFGMKNNNEIFIPTDEPFGLIEATITRSK